MKLLAHTLKVLFYGTVFAVSFIYLGFSLQQKGVTELEAAKVNYESRRYGALEALLKLEALRTNVESANRRALMAEYKLQAVCRKRKIC